MSETVYNLFLMLHNGICCEVRYVAHEVTVPDDEACNFLLKRVAIDLNQSQAIRLSKPFTVDEYEAHTRLGSSHLLWEEVYAQINAPRQPLSVVTSVVDGIAQVEFQCQLGDPDIYLRADLVPGIEMEDWIVKYRTPEGLDLPRLINDDFFAAIKLTFNAKLYVSSMKLLLSAIDSIAYIEFGEYSQNVFTNWLDTYADLTPLGITGDELWELRNGLLHMTNLDSRKVQNQKVRRVTFHVGLEPFFVKDGIHSFSFYELIRIMAHSLPSWLRTYNDDLSKRVHFVSRYDRTLSDSRAAFMASETERTDWEK